MQQDEAKQSLARWLDDHFSDRELRCLCYDLPPLQPAYRRFTAETRKQDVIRAIACRVDNSAQLEAYLSPSAALQTHTAQPPQSLESLAEAVMAILKRYGTETRADLAAEVDDRALQIVGTLVEITLNRLKHDATGAVIVPEFLKMPAVYQLPMAQKLSELLQADGPFAAQLQRLLTQYEQTLASPKSSQAGHSAQQTGDGSLVQGDDNVAAGKGGIAIGGNVTGNITLGGQEKSG